MLSHQPLDSSLTFHSSLKESERQWFWGLNQEELSRTERHGLHVLLEALLATRVPGFQLRHTRDKDQWQREGAALCAHLLHEDNGFGADELRKGRDWLQAAPHPAPAALLAFYFKLRERKFSFHLDLARRKAGIIQQLHLSPTN